MKLRSQMLRLFLPLILVTAACGGSGNDNGGGSATTAPQTQTSGAGGSAQERTEVTYTYEDGATLTLTIPAGWVSDTSAGIELANSQAALDATDTAVSAGQVRGTVGYILDDSEELAALGMRNNSRPMDVVSALIESWTTDTRTFEVETPRSFLVTGTTGAVSNGTATIDGSVLDVTVMVIDKRSGFGQMLFFAPAGEIEQYEGGLRNIAGSITYTAGTAP